MEGDLYKIKRRNPARTPRGDKRDVVDFGVGAPVRAGGDGDFEFSGKIVELRIAAEFVFERLDEGADIGEFVGVNADEWAASDVAGNIAASSGGGKAYGLKAVDQFRDPFDADPVELDVLADGDVRDSVAEFGGKIGDGADLVAGKEAVGDANAHHEKRSGLPFSTGAADDAESVALGVNAPRAEIGVEPVGRNRRVAFAGKLANFVEAVPGVLFALEALESLGFGFLGGGHLAQFPFVGSQEFWPGTLARKASGLKA